ncbi:hypothetical protein [Planctomycetes bacterium TBK1r]|uniref:Uncharacterized protein n=1 Tax=Stieleria magnilauensis TaxID=2527963 RepID=A0ABX5XUM0_9BACT|nr:hypothetical protein TBK1r_47400 [Planctomycetes bacterium TBK1r]
MSTPATHWTDAYRSLDSGPRFRLGWFARSVARIVEPIACFRSDCTAEDLQCIRDMIVEIERNEAVSRQTHRDLNAEC